MDYLGNKIKEWEDKTTLPPHKIAFARLDGKNFHNYTRHFDKPFDKDLSDAMIHAAYTIAVETNAVAAYTQSDEITLSWYNPNLNGQIIFNGKVQKMVSVLASMCTLYFVDAMRADLNPVMPFFDCRVFTVDSVEDAVDVFRWRMLDCFKNSISSLAYEYFSAKTLNGQTSWAKLKMLEEIGIFYEDYPDAFREGTFIKRFKVQRPFSTSEIEKLPPLHKARKNPNLVVERTEYGGVKINQEDYNWIRECYNG